MQTEEALTQIRNTVFRPGCTITAEPYQYGEIAVTFTLDTVDTSYTDDDGKFRTPLVTSTGTRIQVTNLDEVGLCCALLDGIAEMDDHENREFLKVRQPDGSWKALLHPHTPEGELRWVAHKYGMDGLLQRLCGTVRSACQGMHILRTECPGAIA